MQYDNFECTKLSAQHQTLNLKTMMLSWNTIRIDNKCGPRGSNSNKRANHLPVVIKLAVTHEATTRCSYLQVDKINAFFLSFLENADGCVLRHGNHGAKLFFKSKHGLRPRCETMFESDSPLEDGCLFTFVGVFALVANKCAVDGVPDMPLANAQQVFDIAYEILPQ